MSNLTYKFRLYPNKTQIRELEKTLNTCRQVYNWLLSDREQDYEHFGKSPNCYTQINRLKVFRETWLDLQNVHSQVLQNVAVRVDLAFQAFFRRVKAGEKPGYPRFKGKDYYDSFTFPQSGYNILNSKLKMSKIGSVKIKLHRNIVGKIKTCNIKKANNKWYACFSCETEKVTLPQVYKSIGIDVGIEKFAALSDNSFVANPKFFRTEEKSLAKAQRNLSKQVKGSSKRQKAKKVVSRIYERIKNRRHNFIHQESRKIINNFDTIVIEKLITKNMLKNHCLAKSISDASWNLFFQALIYKAENAGRILVQVNPAYTSQTCFSCGNIAKKTLKERWHNCPNCGLSLDRDTNAAKNILALGTQSKVA